MRLVPLVASPLVRLAQFLDPTQHRDLFSHMEDGQLTASAEASLDETLGMLMDFVGGTMRRVHGGSMTANPDSVLGKWTGIAAQQDGWPAIELMAAIKRYIEMDKQSATDALTWWRERASELRPLDSIARWFLCIPATSAESERTFSLAGWLVSPARTRLSAQRANDLLLLRRHLACESETPTGRNSEEAMSSQTMASDEGDLMAELLEDGLATVNKHGLLDIVRDSSSVDDAESS